MKKYWKQLEAWAIELRNNPFNWARFKLASIYTILTVFLFVIANIALFNIWSRALNKVAPGIISPQIQQELSGGFNVNPRKESLYVYLLIIIVIVALSFFITSRTLSPIKTIIRRQRRFIADASHELRTPLTIMKTNSEIVFLGPNDVDPQEAKKALVSNLEEINRMSKIIQNLIALSYYDNSLTEMTKDKIKLSQLISRITKQLKVLAGKKNITLQFLKTDDGIILGNPIAIEEMAINLIKNSIVYTPKNGYVFLSVTNQDDKLEFKVKDTGVGIDKKDLPHVFDPFYKSGQGRSQLERESSGLGLSIVKRIVERHGGSISMESVLGKGTTVTALFPLHTPKE